ncbi:acyl-CoA thioesterase, partial [Bacillus subtilis]
KEIKRVLLSQTVDRLEGNEDGLCDTFFRPLAVTPPPPIIILRGSDGGLDETMAGMLANYGYATLAIPYFQYKQLPKKLV